ncbi:MAG: hypothetical protein JWQ06_668 [Mucilaginibacter sp.]|nr:hypothetical protein [Mucilaginibacter sp.]
MNVENPAALRFIIDNDLYLLDKDKTFAAVSTATVAKTPVIDFKYLGNNKKSFLILVHYSNKEFIDDEHLTALQNILKRKELNMDDVVIMNMAAYADLTFEQVITYFKPQKLLIMGKHALPQNIQTLLLNQPGQLDDCRSLFSFSFDEMMSSTENKKAFWDQMKTL